MKDLFLLATQKAQRLTDEELAEEIRRFESGEQKLYAPDEHGRRVPLHPLILPVLKNEQERRKRKQESK